MNKLRPAIGTAVWIRKGGKVLLGRRAGEKRRGAGEWCPPGGHLELLELLKDCVVRETREEAGIEIQAPRFLTFIEDPQHEWSTHYLTFYYVADWKRGEPGPAEGESEDWGWFAWDKLPKPLFRPARLFVEHGFNPLEF